MKKLDQQFKKRLSTPQAPPLDAWENIEAILDKKKKRRKLIPIWFSASAASVAILVGVYFYKNNENTRIPNTSEFVKSPVKNHSTKQNNRLTITEENNIKNDELVNLNNKKDKSNHENYKYYDAIYTPKFDKQNPFLDYKTNQNLDNLIINQSENNPQIVKSDLNKSTEIVAENNTIQQEKSIEEFILEKDEKNKFTKNENKERKIIVSSFVSPTVLINKNSMLSSEFDLNELDNQFITNYGANISYQLTKNLTVKTGIAKVGLDQVTKNVIISEPTLAGLDYYVSISATKKINQQNIKYNSNLEVSSNNEIMFALNQNNNNTNMKQRVEFLEIPLEIEYSILNNKKFTISAVGGSSYYLLTKNEISIENTIQGNKVIGKATNINDSHFSANTGIKIGYNLNKNINVNVQPSVKLIFNQFNHSDTKTPTLLGINFGASFKIK